MRCTYVLGVLMTVVILGALGALSATGTTWLVVRFLRHVYDRGGADDLARAAWAVSRARARPRA